MASVSKSTNKSSTENKPESSNEDDEEETFIPLAARDSLWVGVNFFNPQFEDDDEKDDDLYKTNEPNSSPFFNLFPNLKEKCTNEIFTTQSTVNITKMLVGQKPNFDIKKNHKLSARTSLPALKEEELLDDLEKVSSL